MTKRSEHHSDFETGQIVLLGAAVIVLLFFAWSELYSHRQRHVANLRNTALMLEEFRIQRHWPKGHNCGINV